jgi:hypothetical protein
MFDTQEKIHFDAPAVLRKWPSRNGERICKSMGAHPYIVVDGTLDDCIRQFMAKPESARHLYEIHTPPQSTLVSATLSPEQIFEIVRLRDFL